MLGSGIVDGAIRILVDGLVLQVDELVRRLEAVGRGAQTGHIGILQVLILLNHRADFPVDGVAVDELPLHLQGIDLSGTLGIVEIFDHLIFRNTALDLFTLGEDHHHGCDTLLGQLRAGIARLPDDGVLLVLLAQGLELTGPFAGPADNTVCLRALCPHGVEAHDEDVAGHGHGELVQDLVPLDRTVGIAKLAGQVRQGQDELFTPGIGDPEGGAVGVLTLLCLGLLGRNADVVEHQIALQLFALAHQLDILDAGDAGAVAPDGVVGLDRTGGPLGVMAQCQDGAGLAGLLLADEGHGPMDRRTGMLEDQGAAVAAAAGFLHDLLRASAGIVAGQDLVALVGVLIRCLDVDADAAVLAHQLAQQVQILLQQTLGQIVALCRGDLALQGLDGIGGLVFLHGLLFGLGRTTEQVVQSTAAEEVHGVAGIVTGITEFLAASVGQISVDILQGQTRDVGIIQVVRIGHVSGQILNGQIEVQIAQIAGGSLCEQVLEFLNGDEELQKAKLLAFLTLFTVDGQGIFHIHQHTVLIQLSGAVRAVIFMCHEK